MTSETRNRFVGIEDVYEPADGFCAGFKDNHHSENSIHAITYSTKAGTSFPAISENAEQSVREDLTCFRINEGNQLMKSVDTIRKLNCLAECSFVFPGFHGDVNNAIHDDGTVQYCSKLGCENKKPKSCNIHQICDSIKFGSGYQKAATDPPRCAQLRNPKLENISSHAFRNFSKNITHLSWQKLNRKWLLLSIILQACIYFAAGKDVSAMQTGKYQPCSTARSSSHLIYERHPNNCSVFYMCHGSRSWPMSCTQDNTVFSVKHKVCVWRNSDFDDCQDMLADVKKAYFRENDLRNLTENRENIGQVKDDSDTTDTHLRESPNKKNINELTMWTSENQAEQVKKEVDKPYNPRKTNYGDSVPVYLGQSLFPVNEKRVNNKLQTQESGSSFGHDSLAQGTKSTNGKKRNEDSKPTMDHTDLEEIDETSTLIDSVKPLRIGQKTSQENHYFSKENYFNNISEDEKIGEGFNDNIRETFNHGSIVDKTDGISFGFDKNNYIRTTTQTNIKDPLAKKNNADSLGYVDKIDSTARLNLQNEHSERTSETSNEEQLIESSDYDYTERTTKFPVNDGYIEQMTPIIKERDVKRKLKSQKFDKSSKGTNKFDGFYEYTQGITDSVKNEEIMETVLPKVIDKNAAILPSTIGSFMDSRKSLSLEDITAEHPDSNEDLKEPAGNSHYDSYTYYNRDSGDKQDTVNNESFSMGEESAESPRSILQTIRYDKFKEIDVQENERFGDTTNAIYEDLSQGEAIKETHAEETKHVSSLDLVQTLLTLTTTKRLQATTEEGEDRSLRTSSYGHNFMEPLHLGKPWLMRPNDINTAPTTDPEIEKGTNFVHLHDQKKHSNNHWFHERTTEKYFNKEHVLTENENYGSKKTLKLSGIFNDHQFSEDSHSVKGNRLGYSSLSPNKEIMIVPSKVLMTESYDDKTTKQIRDGKTNRTWYVINSGLHAQSTEDTKSKHIIPILGVTQSSKLEFADNSNTLKSYLTVQPWPQLTQQLNNKHRNKYKAIDNLRLMETFLRMLNITVHRDDVQVKDVRTTEAPRLKLPRDNLPLTSTVIPKQSWTPERRVNGSRRFPIRLPSWKFSQNDLKVPDKVTDQTLKGQIPKVKPNPKNNGRFFQDGEHTQKISEVETQNGDRLSHNEHIPKYPVVQRWPQQSPNQENQHKEKHFKQTQYPKSQHQSNQSRQNRSQQEQHKQNQYQPSQFPNNQQNHYQQNRNEHNQYLRNKQERNQNEQNQYLRNKHEQNRNEQNQHLRNKHEQNQNEQNQYLRNEHEQNQHKQNQYQQNMSPENRYKERLPQQNEPQHNHNQNQQKQLDQPQLEHLQNSTLKKILRNDVHQKQRTTLRQNSAPQFWEVKNDRPWFEKLLNKDKLGIGQKRKFNNPNYKKDKNVFRSENEQRQNIQISDNRNNYNLDHFKKQRELDFGLKWKDNLNDSKEKLNIRRVNDQKRLDKDIFDNDLKRNIQLLQNENLQKHKQLLLDIRNKTFQKLLNMKIDQISNFYTENDIENESSEYEDADFSFMAQPLPIDPLPRPTKASTTTTTTTSTTTSRDDETKLPHSFDPDHIPNYRKELKDACGIMATPLIIGGQRSRRGQWPWQASLQIVTSTTPWHRCGGVLVHPKWVLTAAHCMEGSFYGEMSNWRVVLADYNLDTVSGNEVYRNIVRVISHPGYVRTSNFPNDVALLELDSPLDMTSGDVQTACMPDSDFPLVPGMKCWISGWGETRGTGGHENIMNEVSVDVLPHDQCKSMWAKVNIDVLDSQVCLGHGLTGACYGDSGGPLMCESEGRFYVAGVMSWLINNCSANNFPNVFTRLPNFTEWLYKELDYFEWMRYL